MNGGPLFDYYLLKFGRGKKKSAGFKQAQRAFCESLAGYSLLSYILAIKDRHNQNIMVDNEGHVVHIDFGFLLSNSPGKNMQFERAPFKLTREFMDVLGGEKSKCFSRFQKLIKHGFMALQE